MIPLRPKAADRDFVVGQVYRLAIEEERSDASHRHEFAEIRSIWENLPEKWAEHFPTAEHLRKRALIETGWHTEQLIDVGTNAGALRVASYVRGAEEFAHVVVRGGYVVIRRPKSQSRRAMPRDEFQASKTAILEWCSALIGVTPEEVRKSA